MADESMNFRPRRGTKTAMASKTSLVLTDGELFLECPDAGPGKGTSYLKIGDGSTAYPSLPYAIGVVSDTAIKLATARTISLGGSLSGSTSFDGSDNVTITVGDIDATKLSGIATINTTGNAATATKLATARTITLSGKVTGSASFDGSGNITINTSVSSAVNADTATKLATARTISITGNATGSTSFDGSKDVSINLTVNSATNCTGNAATATKLANAVTINGISFDGSSNITIPSNADEHLLTDQSLNDITTTGFYYSAASNTVTNKPTGIDSFGMIVYTSGTSTIAQDLIEGNGNTGKKWNRVYVNSAWSDWQYLYSTAYPPTAATNADTATKLATARTIAINGGATGTATSFDGSGNITIPVTALDATKLTGTTTVSTTGNAATATKLATARTITLSGNTTGSASFDGSGNITITTTTTNATNAVTCTGNAATATKLYADRTIALSGGVTGTATIFNGSSNITIPVTAVDLSYLSGTMDFGDEG